MRETGQIVEIQKDGVIISFDSSGGCAKCELNHCCQSTGSGKRQIKIHTESHGYKPGDLVEIETRARSMLTAAFLVFILPVVLAFISYNLISKITQSQSYSLIGFFVIFMIAEILVVIIDRIWGKKKFFEPAIIKKTSQNHPS